jgi:hypothetical protein
MILMTTGGKSEHQIQVERIAASQAVLVALLH